MKQKKQLFINILTAKIPFVLAGFFVSVVSIALAGAVFAATFSDSDTVDVSAVVPSPNTGNGGSGNTTNRATINLSGLSFPSSKITLLVDGVVRTTLVVENDSRFNLTLNNLNLGNYQISIFAEDSFGIISSPYVINVNASSTKAYIFENIILPPTIQSNKLLIPKGENFEIFGYATPGSQVSAEIPGQFYLGTAIADNTGFYRIVSNIDIPSGVYSIRTKATISGFSSLFSRPVQIVFYSIGSEVPPPPAQLGVCVDYNKDGRVNLIDFSILLFWFGKNSPPNSIDCNNDRRIDIKDFSILMYFWTG